MTSHNGRLAAQTIDRVHNIYAHTNCCLVHSVCCQWQLGIGSKPATGLHACNYFHKHSICPCSYSLHSIKTLETRRIKRFPAKTFTNVGMVQQVIKNRVRAPTHHTGNKSPDTRRGALASLAIHNPCRSRFIAFKRLCIHCTQVNILRLQVTLKPLSPSLHLATSFCANYSSDTIVSDI